MTTNETALTLILYFDLDCTRADHLGCYGYHRETSPNVDALTGESLVLDRFVVSDALPAAAAQCAEEVARRRSPDGAAC